MDPIDFKIKIEFRKYSIDNIQYSILLKGMTYD